MPNVAEKRTMADSNIDDMFNKMSEARDRYQAKAMSIPGVFGTSIGIRQVLGKLVAEPAIIFHVEKKRSLQGIPADERIPKELEGFPTDVVDQEPPATDEAARTQAANVNDENKYRPLTGGCQIVEGHTKDWTIGTLGCVVKYIGPDGPPRDLRTGATYVLSVAHVMLGVGNDIFQPTSDKIGSVVASVLDDDVDAAISDIGWKLNKAVPEIIDIGPVKGTHDVTSDDLMLSHNDYSVKKRGRTTGLTFGGVYALHFNGFNIPGADRRAVKNLMMIKAPGNEVFGDHGDSGSVVVNDANQVVGLLTSMGAAGGIASAIPIRTVLDRLKIEILV
jgi:hypothetical protein